jgi:uncharacterized protein YgiM (DUF1202 family)
MQVRYWIMAAGVLLSGGWTLAQETGARSFEPYMGQITVETLNVRSGPSTNYYVVTRLPKGGYVRVVGEEAGWLAIAPPPGCFSLIAAQYVDRAADGKGVVNTENVRVRAGSTLSDHNYAVQTKLAKGAAVKIIGPADEQFLKIEPPAGTKLWVSAEYVRRAPGAPGDTGLAAATPPATETRSAPTPLVAESASPAAPPGTGTALATPSPLDEPPGFESPALLAESASRMNEPAVTTAVVTAPAVEPSAAPGDTAAKPKSETKTVAAETAPVSADDYRRQLDAAEAVLKEELAKPLQRRDFTALLPRFRVLADQNVDAYTAAYAGIRIQQMEAARDLTEGLQQVRELHDGVRTVRKEALADRADLWPLVAPLEGGFDAEGELRPSALYDSPIGPHRYRLVDPTTVPPRTLGYVEVPPDVSIDITEYLGRHVGVRARERILQTGNVNPIALYVAAELVVLDRSGEETQNRLAGPPANPKETPAASEKTTAVSRP